MNATLDLSGVVAIYYKDVEVEGIAPSSKGSVIKGSPCSVSNQFNSSNLCRRDFEERSV